MSFLSDCAGWSKNSVLVVLVGFEVVKSDRQFCSVCSQVVVSRNRSLEERINIMRINRNTIVWNCVFSDCFQND